VKSSLRFLTDGIVTPLPTASATITRTFKAVRPLRFVRRLEIGLSGEIRATIVPPATEHPNSACFVEQTEVFPDRTPKRAVKPSIVMHDRDTKFTAQAATGSARISIRNDNHERNEIHEKIRFASSVKVDESHCSADCKRWSHYQKQMFFSSVSSFSCLTFVLAILRGKTRFRSLVAQRSLSRN
jgi:hypothetical protein